MAVVKLCGSWEVFRLARGGRRSENDRNRHELSPHCLRPDVKRRTASSARTHLLDFVTACWLGIIGACIGSFLNVVAYRWPRGMSVVWKPSHCPKCGHDIRARDNLPVLGWLLLRGRCRDCGSADFAALRRR